MPNLFEIMSARRLRNVINIRQERIKREGSKYYTWEPGVTATTASVEIHVPDQFPDSRKYQPLDWIEIVNNEPTNDITVTINNNDQFVVPAKTIRTIDNQSLWNVRVTNDGGANTTVGLIVLTMQKQPLTIDKWARRQ